MLHKKPIIKYPLQKYVNHEIESLSEEEQRQQMLSDVVAEIQYILEQLGLLDLKKIKQINKLRLTLD